jgi:hypothetical protein
MTTPLDQELRAKFTALPFDARRIARHVDAGDVRLGDFMCTYEAIRIGIASRPPGRGRLCVGDVGRLRHLKWSVTAIEDENTYIDVEVGTQLAGVVCAGGEVVSSVYPNEAMRVAIEDLFAPVSLDRELAKVDAWDWTPGMPAHGFRVEPCDDDSGEWLVVSAPGVFTWNPAANTIRPQRRTDNIQQCASLFVRTPAIG